MGRDLVPATVTNEATPDILIIILDGDIERVSLPDDFRPVKFRACSTKYFRSIDAFGAYRDGTPVEVIYEGVASHWWRISDGTECRVVTDGKQLHLVVDRFLQHMPPPRPSNAEFWGYRGTERTRPMPTFWMTPRELFHPERSDFQQLRAVITHTALYGGPLLISDSDFINNLHLRDAVVSGDPFVIPLLESGYLRLAIREENGQPVPLGATAEGIYKRGGHTPQIPAERFKESPEFQFVQEHGQSLTYSLDGAAERYHRETLRLLEMAPFTAEELAPEFRRAILAVVHERAQTHKLDWSYFTGPSTFWDALQQRLPGVPVRERLEEFLVAATRGPYATFIPTVLGLNPTYSHEDRLGVDLWRGRVGMTEEALERKTLKRARIGLGDYVKGLASLSVKAIEALRASGEFAAYEAGCEQVARGTLFPEEPLLALHQYRLRIDDAVLTALARRRAGDEFEEEYRATALHEHGANEAAAWCRFGVGTLIDAATYGLYSICDFGFQRVQRLLGWDDAAAAAREERLKEAQKEAEIARLAGSPTIDAVILADRPSVRDIYTEAG